jgi:hypothetical protein
MERGKGEFFSFFLLGVGSCHPSMEWRNNHATIYFIVRRELARGTDPRLSQVMLFFILFF